MTDDADFSPHSPFSETAEPPPGEEAAPESAAIQSNVQISPQPLPAGFWLRVLAALIDHQLVQLGFATLALATGYLTSELVSSWVFTLLNLTGGALALIGTVVVGIIGALLVSFVLSAATLLLVQPLFESSRLQGTPGKLIVGIKVTSLEGQSIHFGQALFRQIAKILPLLGMTFLLLLMALAVRSPAVPRALSLLLAFSVFALAALYPLQFLVVALTPRKQGLHDLIAGTLVSRRERFDVSRVFLGIAVAIALLLLTRVMYPMNSGRSSRTQTPAPAISVPILPTPLSLESAAMIEPPATPIPPNPTPVLISEDQASLGIIDGVPYALPFSTALFDEEKSSLEILFFRERPANFDREQLRVKPESVRGTADLLLTLNFQIGERRVNTETLRNYVVGFNKQQGGFMLPDSTPGVEFARARTWGQGREIYTLAGYLADGSAVDFVFQGKGSRRLPNLQTVEFAWNLSFHGSMVGLASKNEVPRP